MFDVVLSTDATIKHAADHTPVYRSSISQNEIISRKNGDSLHSSHFGGVSIKRIDETALFDSDAA
jgi:hypothetical protein